MKCNEVTNKMIFLISGELPPDWEDRMLKHINYCSECSKLYKKMKSTLQMIEEEKVFEKTPNFSNRVLQRIEQQNHYTTYSVTVLRILKPATISLLAAAAVLTGIMLGGKFPERFTNPVNERNIAIEAFASEYFPGELDYENIELILLTQNNH